ncbi:MAG: hypothetical protein HY851_08520 [candidate division Zixibacteria bacterium]|nr:hypothetical protein [candidate division Zixibacteria bacterium]
MLEGKFQRGFSPERLASTVEPKVRRDERGYFIMSLSESTKVYFEDFYSFLRTTYDRAGAERDRIRRKLLETPRSSSETISFYRAQLVIIDLLQRTIRRFYTDGSNLGVVMTPWCFGTVVLEKIEVYRDQITRGDLHDPNITEFPYYVVKYIDEIYKKTLLDLFDFPEQAFQMRWQYTELLKRYSAVLSDITVRLQSVLTSVKNLGGK